MYRVPVKPLKYFPSSGCGLNGCWGSSLKFAASERNEWHLRCCCVEQSFLFNLQFRTVARKVANKIACAMLLRNKCSLQQNIFVKVTKKNFKGYKSPRLSLVRALFPCLKNMHRGISVRQKGHATKARNFFLCGERRKDELIKFISLADVSN